MPLKFVFPAAFDVDDGEGGGFRHGGIQILKALNVSVYNCIQLYTYTIYSIYILGDLKMFTLSQKSFQRVEMEYHRSLPVP